jgi:hypothetical protein
LSGKLREHEGQSVQRDIVGARHADHTGLEVGGVLSREVEDVAPKGFQLADHATGLDHAGVVEPDGGLAVAGDRGAGVEARALHDAVDQPDRRDMAGNEVVAREDAAKFRRGLVLIFPARLLAGGRVVLPGATTVPPKGGGLDAQPVGEPMRCGDGVAGSAVLDYHVDRRQPVFQAEVLDPAGVKADVLLQIGATAVL